MGLYDHHLQSAKVQKVAPASDLSGKDKTILGINGPVKRAFDILISAALIVFLLPVFALTLVLVKTTSRGPVLFKQKRIGRGGKLFHMLKFRSMFVDADVRLEAMLDADALLAMEWRQFQKLRNDPRITKIGHLLRKTSIDELPQLFNVLKGDMSLVGQRPILPKQRDDYGPHIAGYELARPGLTGLWQVSGRNALSFSDRAELGSQYLEDWTLGKDLKILVKTVPAVLLSRDAF